VGSDHQNTYFIKLLKLALSKTEAEEGPVELRIFPEHLSGARFMAEIKNNRTIDVIWNGTSPQRERELLPVRISLLKVLNENRVLLIRKEDQQKFAAVKSLEDLRMFIAGAGADWPSADIMRHNNMPVTTVTNTDLLFPMLRAKRFDYISRNLSEAWAEAQAFEKEGLVIERSLLLRGGVPFYFFVHKSNRELAGRIERGLQRAQADGSFDALFMSEPGFQRGLEILSDPDRRVLELSVRQDIK
jgi:ABC-type amino acid transport substrate-binding protein